MELWNHKGEKAVRELQVLVKGEQVWQGTISNDHHQCTRIPLSQISEDELKLTHKLQYNDYQRMNKVLSYGTISPASDDWVLCQGQGFQDSVFDEMHFTEAQEEDLDDADNFDEKDFQDIESFMRAESEEKPIDGGPDSYEEIMEPDLFTSIDDMKHEELTLKDTSNITELVALVKATKDFRIPILPRGSRLTINIHSTWGDPHYVGLSGIEVFDELGQLIFLNARKQIKVSVTNANLRSGSYYNPCFVERLVDNVNLTCDDSHMWLAPFSLDQPCSINIAFERATSIGMIRFWNYNKSIIHSFRGARMVTMFLDSELIFSGEIQKASGLLSDAFKHAEPILFTDNEETISFLELYDVEVYEKDSSQSLEFETFEDSPGMTPTEQSPPDMSRQRWIIHQANGRESADPGSADQVPIGRVLKLKLLRSWGDCYYFGLTGIQVLDRDGVAQTIQPELITAKPRDLNDIPGHKGDYRTLDKLVDGCNVTTDDRHMWLVPYDGPEAEHHMEITFKTPVTMAALRIWNYNKSLDDSFRGVKWIQVFVDDVEVSPCGGHLVKKAPGTDKFDFGQLLPLNRRNKRNLQQLEKHQLREKFKLRRIHTDVVKQEYSTPLLPCGHVVKFSLLSTWGDPQYVGLNGIELYDEHGHIVPVSKQNLCAVPDMSTHYSNPEKLFKGTNNNQNMWLSVLDYNNGNNIYIHFNDPIMISYLRIWNYNRNPTFGVREIEIYVDDLLVYKGYLRKAVSQNSKQAADTQNTPQSILFSGDEKLVRANEDSIFYCGGIPNADVVLINDNYVINDVQAAA